MQEQPRKRGGLDRLLFSLGLLLVALWLFVNRQMVVDQIAVWRYQPSAEVAALAENIRFSEAGKFYFYASQPEVSDRGAFSQQCSSHGEEAAVLGCYVGWRIYVFDVTDPRLDGIKEVTAAHEMLHAVYDRLSSAERSRVNGLLEQQLKIVTDTRILDLVALYDKIEPGERLNEIHSIFATELPQLSPELESYYGRYLADRQRIVGFAQQYEQVFASIKTQQEQLAKELDALAEAINLDTQEYNATAEQLKADIAAFNARADAGGYASQAAFNADRQALIARQNAVTRWRSSINAQISAYNEKRELLEAVNGQVEELNQSINANALEPEPAI